MILYHGSNLEIKQPSLKYSRSSLDFGSGFIRPQICSRLKSGQIALCIFAKTVNQPYRFLKRMMCCGISFQLSSLKRRIRIGCKRLLRIENCKNRIINMMLSQDRLPMTAQWTSSINILQGHIRSILRWNCCCR